MKNEDFVGLQEKFAAFLNKFKNYDFYYVECAERNHGTQVVFMLTLNAPRVPKDVNDHSDGKDYSHV